MKKILDEIVDWPAEAKRGGYRVQSVAENMGVSARWLELYFQSRFGKSPIALFAEWREEEIQRLAADGKSGKEILNEIGLSHCSSLTRCLARHGKPGLREIQRDNRGGVRRRKGDCGKGRVREHLGGNVVPVAWSPVTVPLVFIRVNP